MVKRKIGVKNQKLYILCWDILSPYQYTIRLHNKDFKDDAHLYLGNNNNKSVSRSNLKDNIIKNKRVCLI